MEAEVLVWANVRGNDSHGVPRKGNTRGGGRRDNKSEIQFYNRYKMGQTGADGLHINKS